MNAIDRGAPASPKRLFPELLLMLGLPILAVFIGGTLAITAYVKGFTQLPEPAAQVAPHR
ncbi:MAG TPA: hypothetical protein VFA75_04315 [Nevskia sp.]|jgi:hypothetical protein|nr:hypothetical protein [Nevskia sp.]